MTDKQVSGLAWSRKRTHRDAAPGLGQRSKDKVTEQGRPLHPVALGQLDVYMRKANLDTDLMPFTKSALMGQGPRRETPTRRRPMRCTGTTDALGVEVAADRTPEAQPAGETTDEPAAFKPRVSAVQKPGSRE